MIDHSGHKLNESSFHAFPSVNLLVRLYTVGALASIVLSFALPLDSAQITFCLAIGWVLTSVALGMSVFGDAPLEDLEEE